MLAFLVALTAVGLLVARQVKSPAEREAETAAPARTVLTAVVERRVLTSTLIDRGTVVADREVSVTPPAEPGGAPVQVVTAIGAQSGETVHAGQAVLAISGRPLIALLGVLPAYRDLGLGAIGPDVSQLQKALPGGTGADKTGVFGGGTQAALIRLYKQVGYPAARRAGRAFLPMAEVAYLPAFPAVVTQLTAAVGDVVKAPLVGFASGALHVDVQLDPGQAGLVTRGLRAVLTAEALDQQADGAVGSVGAVTTTVPAGSDNQSLTVAPAASTVPYVPVHIVPDKPLATSWFGQDVRTTLTSARTSGPVLLVPSAALSTAADGSTSVVVSDAGAKQRVVTVKAGASGDGYVEVSPAAGSLAAGDRVIVGQ